MSKNLEIPFEKVNMYHPDKVADRIAGALVDIAYKHQDNPKVAIEVLIGHDVCTIITESSYCFDIDEVMDVVKRISESDSIVLYLYQNQQDAQLAKNQECGFKCGDNGIFKGVKTSGSEYRLTNIVKDIASVFKTDGKYIINGNIITACQSYIDEETLSNIIESYCYESICNPLGYWTGGVNVDCGATNRKLGSDMGRSATGGGLMGKDVSKADVSVNIYCYLKAQETGNDIYATCNIGDEYVLVNNEKIPFCDIVKVAKEYIDNLGGFERLAEYGLIR